MERKQQLKLNEELNSSLNFIDALDNMVQFEGTSSLSVHTF